MDTVNARKSGSRSGNFFTSKMNNIQRFRAFDSITIIFIILIMLIIVGITLFIVYMIKRNNVQQSNLTQDKFYKLDDKDNPYHTIEADKLNAGSATNDYSLSFWVFLTDNYDVTDQHKVIFYRGRPGENSGPTASILTLQKDTNPIVVMHKNTNKMMIAVATRAVTGTKTLDEIFHQNDAHEFDSGYLVGVIDYVPLQRWVHVSIVILENIMRIYFDGEIYMVSTTSDVPESIRNGNGGMIMFRSNTDDLTIGHKSSAPRGFTAGYNYASVAISQNHVRSLYSKGPVKGSFLNYFGISRYGIQSPIYKVDQ